VRLNPAPRAPLKISHRGAHSDLPENSIPAFLRALELGADAIELDVHGTGDGEVVVHHDFTVSAEGVPTPAPIASITAADLDRFPLASGIRIPALSEVLTAIGNRAIIFVEIKAPEIEQLVVRDIRESEATCVVHSFDHRIVLNVKKIFPAIRTGILQVARPVNPIAALQEARADDLWQHVDYVDEQLVSAAHNVGARVIAWTANDRAQWQHLTNVGVDGICTDEIGKLAAATPALR
jgi:glycerophosphoryl diester phosphodiesterase